MHMRKCGSEKQCEPKVIWVSGRSCSLMDTDEITALVGVIANSNRIRIYLMSPMMLMHYYTYVIDMKS